MSKIKVTDKDLHFFELGITNISHITHLSECAIWEGVKMVLLKFKDQPHIDLILRDMHHRFGTGEMNADGSPDGYLELDKKLQAFFKFGETSLKVQNFVPDGWKEYDEALDRLFHAPSTCYLGKKWWEWSELTPAQKAGEFMRALNISIGELVDVLCPETNILKKTWLNSGKVDIVQT